MNKQQIISSLFDFSDKVRYVAILHRDDLVCRQRKEMVDASAGETDRYEELLVNPTLLKLATQRGNIDCGGLRFIIVGYGSFFQVIKEIPKGHISICLEKDSDLTSLPVNIFNFLDAEYNISEAF